MGYKGFEQARGVLRLVHDEVHHAGRETSRAEGFGNEVVRSWTVFGAFEDNTVSGHDWGGDSSQAQYGRGIPRRDAENNAEWHDIYDGMRGWGPYIRCRTGEDG